MNRNFYALSLGVGALLLAAHQAFAAGQYCATHDTIVERLADGYGESRQAMGLAANNAVIELFASTDTGTWTLTVTTAGGPTCLIASGGDYQAVAEPLPQPGKGA